MMIRTYVVNAALLVLLTLSGNSFARSDIPIEGGSDFLVSACREVVEIYDARKEGKFLASQRTSLNEGIKAGYCMGVVYQYRDNARRCYGSKRDWFEMAYVIANSNLTESRLNRITVSDLLEEAYCGL